MQNRTLSIVGIILLVISIFGVLNLKQKMLDLKILATELDRQLEQEKDTLYILKAENAYLESPERIKKLADKYLKLDAIKAEQIVNTKIENIDDKVLNEKMQLANKSSKKKWRYKKTHSSKYITTVSEIR